LGEVSEAEALLARASETLRQHPSQEAWLAPYVDSVRAVHLSKTGDVASAERLLPSAYESMRTRHGPHRSYTMVVADRLVDFYRSHDRPEEANKYAAVPVNPPCPSLP
ncbi:MAG TPA: hypothetical protein VNM90_16715, partial [Haliangium sp.]|nr:hypothetical protein [Haliangium sp.]